VSNTHRLKDGADIHDLRAGQKAQLLGLLLSRRDGRLHLQPGRDAWEKLEQALAMSHETANPTETARLVVNGWIASYGPAFEDWRVTTLDRLLRTAARLGFREVTSLEDLADQLELAWRRWNILYKRVAGRPPGAALHRVGEGLSGSCRVALILELAAMTGAIVGLRQIDG
jgi:hypothetical protein